MHPLYPVANRLVGKYVYCAHVSGRVHYGLLQSVTSSGVYLMPSHGIRPIKQDSAEDRLDFAIQQHSFQDNGSHQENTDTEFVYFPGAYLAFGALTGLGLGLAFGAARPSGYGYGGYGGYGGYSGYGGWGYGRRYLW